MNFSWDGVALENKSSSKETANRSSSKETANRREFLIKSGKYALYASPVIITMLAPRVGIYAQSGPAN